MIPRMPRAFALTSSLSLLLLLAACGDDADPDAGPRPDGGGEDAGPPDDDACPEELPALEFFRGEVGTTVGVTRRVRLDLARDWCEPVEIALTASEDGVATFSETVSMTLDQSRALVAITGAAEGTTTLTATWRAREMLRTATIDVVVTDAAVPGCDGSATGRVAPGGDVSVSSGELAGAAVTLPAGASRDDSFHVDPFDVTIECAPDQLPDGYRALGPAVSFAPGTLRFGREVPLTIPVKLSLLPEGGHRGHVLFSYTGPGVAEARVVPVASPYFRGSSAGGTVTFETPRLGTYQAIVAEAGPTTREREFTFQGITGVSMGSSGAGGIGLRNPELFDFIAPLGGSNDWIYLTDYIRTYHTGGFCTEDERAVDPEGCAAGASSSRVPPSRQVYEFIQDFEHWHYDDEYRGQGGTFDRQEYAQIFRDLTLMYGNFNTNRTRDPSEPNLTPPGIPDSRRDMTDAERCATPLVIPPCEGTAPDCAPGTGYIDDEYNPDGQYPAITFCEGAELVVDGERDHGVWDPEGEPYYPIEVALAFDIDGDGERGPGEPVVRNGYEPYDDCGLDRLCNPDEEGYDPVDNPDPAGDDYDYQFNPAGTEGNWLRDGEPCEPESGEAFLDVGLDGVLGTRQIDDGGFDDGEGDGCFTLASGRQRMYERNARGLVLEHPISTLQDLDVFSDGGIRDLFLFGVVHNHFAGAFSARGLPLNLYNAHAALRFQGEISDEDFNFTNVDFSEIGKYLHIRYGDPDADEGLLEMGDGGHVGTGPQAVNRILSALAWMSARWPGGDRRIVQDRICTEVRPGCDNQNQFIIDFTSSVGRTGPATVILPPGYYDEAYADTCYPIVYFGHGYGMQPEDLIAIGIIIWNFFTSRQIPTDKRLQKMIFVFPDGFCRGGECEKGTFYENAPPGTPGGAQMETFMLELMEHMRDNFRVCEPRSIMVTE